MSFRISLQVVISDVIYIYYLAITKDVIRENDITCLDPMMSLLSKALDMSLILEVDLTFEESERTLSSSFRLVDIDG
jgi:hypothetical protein